MLLNVALAAHLWLRPARSRTTLEPSTSVDIQKSVGGRAATAVANSSTDAPKTLEPDVAPLRWSDLESTDYRQYIANLRAAGCPEQTVRDVVTADLRQVYLQRYRQIWTPVPVPYWKRGTNQTPNTRQIEQLSALRQEQADVLNDLLGVRTSGQDLVDLVHHQVTRDEQQLSLFPPDKREAALQALKAAGLDTRESSIGSSADNMDQSQRFEEKLKVLASVLSPEELDLYHIANSPARTRLGSSLRYFNLTQDELVGLLSAMEEDRSQQQPVKAAVLSFFGEERTREFEFVSSAEYMTARSGAEEEGVPLDRVEQAARLGGDYVKSLLATANDKTLSIEDRKARKLAMQSQAEGSIEAILGKKASRALLLSLRRTSRVILP